MKFSSSSTPALISLVAAVSVVDAAKIHVEQRQASSAAAPPASGASTVRTGAAASLTFSLASTNPTAIPLSSITATMATVATIPLASTPPAGASPSAVAGAPGLPDAASIDPRKYPALDLPPPIDSPEVQAWKQEVQNSGVTIPPLSPTLPGGCPANPQAVADTSRCWWTCGGCTQPTDISDCPTKNTWGLTFDDGPGFYTPNLLDYLDTVDLKATFFVVGSRCVSNPRTLQLEYMKGHQLSVHTWSHPALTTLTNDEIIAELGWARKIIKDVTGVTPNTMRPPFGDIDNRVRAIAKAMNLTPVMWSRVNSLTLDTDDFNVHNGMTTAPQVLNNWNSILGNASSMTTGFIVLQHDLFQETVDIATGYILPDALKRNLKIQPVVSCLNKPMQDSYIETNDNKTNPPAVSASNVVTLASGAPGSAQATGATGRGNGAYQNAPMSVSTTLLGLALTALLPLAWL